MQLPPILIGVIAALSATATATQTFANRGTTQAGWDNRYHSEVRHSQGYHRGEQGFYGFAFRLQQGLAFIADFTDSHCDDWMPSSMVWIIGDQLATRVKTGSVCHQDDPNEFKNLATVSAGNWHKVVIQASWQNDNTGFYKLWFDGVKGMKGTQPFRQVWYDQIGMGTTFANADPDQWS
ncbi:polysaccharide lyase-domain-containing protein [Mycena olivaceomarginata]|nr:polysaccharide lyase-domain-containing protein [Mycena olivaceomarginata]